MAGGLRRDAPKRHYVHEYDACLYAPEPPSHPKEHIRMPTGGDRFGMQHCNDSMGFMAIAKTCAWGAVVTGKGMGPPHGALDSSCFN